MERITQPNQITEKKKVIDLIDSCPQMEEFFLQRGMYCRTCKGNINCTLRKVSYYYGLLPTENLVEEVRHYFQTHCMKPKLVKGKGLK
jgi:hypothetical protein